ncbi:DUF484 family protein [Aliiglaciecola lipolytica]|uniref:DUF484 domain-containing protein n=1 Tax=Aliiglaciecola lipolytica E3 TaxID=1127673 RepID=K6X4G8_9ALTE|nr:DUF484 family protein [Aliiglaciecola lipolytica]GAC15519.1 hypothetical protein GLIP_2898 [Aliiglaciecola lipolytica E3]
MSDTAQQQVNRDMLTDFDEVANVISAKDVKDYLLDNPEFFVEYPELAEKLAIPHQQKGSVSLVELQSEQLRKKNRLLSHKLNQLISVAKQNEEIYRIYADLNLQLLCCRFFSEVQDVLEDFMRPRLKLSAVVLKSFSGAHALPEIQRKLFIEKRFKHDCFFFGRLSQHEKQLLFTDGNVESVALMLLGDKGDLGILAIGSKDASHFNPDMDTLLITQLQQFLNVILPNLAGY